MTKKDFAAIAAVIKEVRETVDCSSYSDVSGAIAKRISAICTADNGRLDKPRFLRACGVE